MTWVGGIYIATHMNMKELGLSEIVKNRKDQKNISVVSLGVDGRRLDGT